FRTAPERRPRTVNASRTPPSPARNTSANFVTATTLSNPRPLTSTAAARASSPTATWS
ncbi:unnamed protein product, partial [Ectocarpus fasciculatus]